MSSGAALFFVHKTPVLLYNRPLCLFYRYLLLFDFIERSFAVSRKSTRVGKFKMKTHKATSKRFRLTGSGILVRTKGGKSHFRRRTSERTKVLLSEMLPVQGKGIIKRVKALAPYLKKTA